MADTARRNAHDRAIAIGVALSAVAALGVAAQGTAVVHLGPANAVFDVADELFTAVTSIRELNDGRVLVTDYRENRIALLDLGRKRSMPVGRLGDGPGEYRGAGWLHPIANDSSILVDYMTRRWIMLQGATPVETFPSTHPLIHALSSQLNGADRSGHVLGTVAVRQSNDIVPQRENADSLGVVLATWPSPVLDTVARIKGRGPGGVCAYLAPGSRPRVARPGIPKCNRLPSEDRPLLFSDGWIAVAMTDPYRVDWRAPNGRWTRGAPLPHEPISVDEQMKCEILGQRPGLGPIKSCDSAWNTWPKTMPPFLSRANAATAAPFSPIVLATSDNNLLIRRTSTSRSASTRYDLIDRRSLLIATLELSPGEAVVGFGSESVYVAETTDYGLQILRRHPWPPAATKAK